MVKFWHCVLLATLGFENKFDMKSIERKEIHRPVRMCTSCRGRFFKKDLLRVVRVKDKKGKSTNIKLDTKQKLMGRGIYICCRMDCFKKLKKNVAKKKSFFGSLSNELLTQIEGAIVAFEEL